MGDRWPDSCYFLEAASRISSKQHLTFMCRSHQAFSQSVSLESKWYNHTVVQQLWRIRIQVVQPNRHTTTLKNSYFALDCYIISKLLTAVHAFPICVLTFFSVDEILLLRYVNWSSNFIDLPFNVEMASSGLEHTYTHTHSHTHIYICVCVCIMIINRA